MKYLVMVILLTSTLAFGKIVNLDGEVYINGIKASNSSKVNIGDIIEVTKNSKVSFNINQNVFMGKNNSKFSIKKGNGNNKVLDIVKGNVLAVFKKGSDYTLKTANMTAGIRGTGVYANIQKGKTYFCTCYGETDFKTKQLSRNMQATHHNPIWVNHKHGDISNAGMAYHTDDELRALEKVVNRIPAFDKEKDLSEYFYGSL